ncbi:hypothetical protein D3C83_01520 [compost metagenome]
MPGHVRHQQRHITAHEVGGGEAHALVRDVEDFQAAGALKEHYGGEMGEGARSRGPVRQLARVCPGVGDQLLQVPRRHRRMDHERRRRDGDDVDRDEIPGRIVRRAAHYHGVQYLRAGVADQQRVAVGLGARDFARADDAARAGPVLDHDRAELRRHALHPHAADGVHHAAGRERNDHPYRPGGILRLRARREQPRRARCGQDQPQCH